MTLKVTITRPNYPADAEFDIRGLGMFKNGKEREITDEEEARYVARFNRTVREALGSSSNVSVKGRATAKADDTGTEGGES